MTKAKKDSRLFARLDLDYADHPKIEALSDAAFRAHVSLILYARKYQTDGRIPNRVANRFGSDAVAELLSNDADAPSLVQLDDGSFLLHGYEDMQETKAEIARRSAVARENGRLGGRPRGTRSVTHRDTGSVPDSEPDRQAETETETDTSPNGEGARKRASTRRGTRIPQPFVVTGDMRAWAAQEVPGLDVDRSTRSFVDYWRGVAGAKGTKLDWVGTWRNWLRKDHERSPGGRAGRPSSVESGLTLVQRFEADEQGAIGA